MVRKSVKERRVWSKPFYWGWLLALALVLTGCLPEGVRVPESPFLRTLERKSGLVAYVSIDGNIYTVNQGGGNQTAVTSDAQLPDDSGGDLRVYQLPSWSPDGERLAFVGISGSDGTPDAAGLYTAGRDGTGLVEAYASDRQVPLYLYWAPDGQHLGFLSSTESGDTLSLQMVPAEGGEAQILDVGEPYYWTWSPDSQTMLIHAGGASRNRSDARLAFLSLYGGVAETGLDIRPASFQTPAWSPDGKRMLMAIETDDGNNALVLADRDGKMQRVLTTFDGSIAFGWSPDGKKVAYIASNRQPPGIVGPLTVIDPEKSFDSRVTADETQVIAFFWSPNSRKLAYFVPSLFSPTPEPDQPESSEQVQVLLSIGILDVKRGESQSGPTFPPTDDFLGILPYFDQYQHSATIWSPDSRNLVLSSYTNSNEPGIWIVAASGNLEPRYLTAGTMAFWSWK
jgi:TolB protein